MSTAPYPEGEPERIETLRDLAILDTLPEAAYDDITRIAANLCAAPIALVSLVDEDRQWFKSKVGLDLVETPREHAFCAHAILDPDHLMVVEDAASDPRFANNPFVTAPGGIRFYAGAPLVTGDGHALGTLCVIDRVPRSLTAVQREALGALARQVVVHLELRRLVRRLERSRDELAAVCATLEHEIEATARDLRRAEQIQRSLLPHRMPELGNCVLQSLYRPGRSVGGDLFDVLPIGDRYLALVVADAAGHGLSAALLALLFRHHLHLVDAAGGPVPPARVLERVNAGLRTGNLVPGLFVTAVVALYDLRRGEIAIASAGHPPVLWLHEDGRMEALSATGPALGLLDHAEFGTLELQLGAVDRLLFYTDGLAELRGPSPATVDELGALLTRIGRRRDALDALCRALAAGAPTRERDDVTALLLDLGSGESCCLEPEADAAAPLPVAGPVAAPTPVIRRGESADATFLVLGGRVTWQYADTLLDAARAVLDARRRLVIDLAECEYLDSTVLGSLHELACRADELGVLLVLQRVPERVGAAFAELSLDTVRRHVGAAAAALPAELAAMEVTPRDPSAQRERLLQAHRTLAGLSERNRELFAGVIDALNDG